MVNSEKILLSKFCVKTLSKPLDFYAHIEEKKN
jgi:hypothetical protein